MSIPMVVDENVPVSVSIPSSPIIPMMVRNGGDSTDYITHGELMAILANYVPRNEFDNGSIVRWKGGQRNV